MKNKKMNLKIMNITVSLLLVFLLLTLPTVSALQVKSIDSAKKINEKESFQKLDIADVQKKTHDLKGKINGFFPGKILLSLMIGVLYVRTLSLEILALLMYELAGPSIPDHPWEPPEFERPFFSMLSIMYMFRLMLNEHVLMLLLDFYHDLEN